jgi:hypothetical protein
LLLGGCQLGCIGPSSVEIAISLRAGELRLPSSSARSGSTVSRRPRGRAQQRESWQPKLLSVRAKGLVITHDDLRVIALSGPHDSNDCDSQMGGV